jgi:hypothetical protein
VEGAHTGVFSAIQRSVRLLSLNQIVSTVLHANTIAKITIDSGPCKEELSGELGGTDKLAQMLASANLKLKPCDFENEADGTPRTVSVSAGASALKFSRLRGLCLCTAHRALAHTLRRHNALCGAGYTASIVVNVSKEEGPKAIDWSWSLPDKDVSFEVAFEPLDGGPRIPIAAETKWTSGKGVCKGNIDASSLAVGSVVFTWDNSYSWMSAKTVQFCIKVE